MFAANRTTGNYTLHSALTGNLWDPMCFQALNEMDNRLFQKTNNLTGQNNENIISHEPCDTLVAKTMSRRAYEYCADSL